MPKRFIGALLLVAGLLGAPALAKAEILILDDFSDAGNINGKPTTTSFNQALWKSGSDARSITSDGDGATINPLLQQLAVIDLGEGFFGSDPGVYALSLDVTFPEGGDNESMWVAVGFTNGNATSSCFNAKDGPNGGAPWMLLRAKGSGLVFAGRGLENALSEIPADYPAGQPHHLKLILDTTKSVWTLQAFMDDTAILLEQKEPIYSFKTNPEIRYVGLSANPGGEAGGGFATATVDNFKLEKISGTNSN